MGGGGEEKKENDLYAVLGLEKECSSIDLKTAYRKLAKKWHPDRCAASGNSTIVEEAKKKFQDVQGAYSVLSDENKRLLYDLGIYDDDDDENNNMQGMGDFLNEMVATMSQIKPTSDNGEDSFKEFKELFDEIIQPDNILASASTSTSQVPIPSSSYTYSYSASGANNKRSYSVASSSSSSSWSSFSTASFSHILSGREDLERVAGVARDTNSSRKQEDLERVAGVARETNSSRKQPSWNGRRRRLSSIDVDGSSEDLAGNWTKQP